MLIDPQINPFEWVTGHIHLAGWMAIMGFVYKATRFLTKAETRFEVVEGHVHKLATNCAPTIQASLQNQDGILKNVDASLKKQDEFLESVDGSLKTLVERQSPIKTRKKRGL